MLGVVEKLLFKLLFSYHFFPSTIFSRSFFLRFVQKYHSIILNKIFFIFLVFLNLGGVQNLEWSNVERPVFRNFKITDIKIAKDQLSDYFIYEFWVCSFFLNNLNTKYWIIFPNFTNFLIFKFRKLYYFSENKIKNFLNFTISFSEIKRSFYIWSFDNLYPTLFISRPVFKFIYFYHRIYHPFFLMT